MKHELTREIELGGLWWVRGKATYQDPWIVLEPSEEILVVPLEYLPLDPRRPDDNLAAIAVASVQTPADAAQVASQFGLLRHGPKSDDHRELFTDWQRQASIVSLTLDIWHQLWEARRGRPGELRSSLPQYEEALTGKTRELPETDEALLEHARNLIDVAVSLPIEEVRIEVRRHQLRFEPETLLELVYLEVMALTTSDIEVRRCERCGRWFKPKNKVMKFCSSTCANWVRNQRRIHRISASAKQDQSSSARLTITRQRESASAVDAGKQSD